MTHRLVRTVGTLAMVLSLAGVAQAQWKHCEIKALEGSWAYTETGTIVNPQTNALLTTMAVGRYTFGRDGTVTAIQWGSTQGNPIPARIPPALVDPPDTKNGTYTVDEDTCTITMLLYGYKGNDLIRKSAWQVFFADNGKEMRGISRLLLFNPAPPNGQWFDLKPVMTMTGTRVRDRGEEWERDR
jgi:hypothetical protein